VVPFVNDVLFVVDVIASRNEGDRVRKRRKEGKKEGGGRGGGV